MRRRIILVMISAIFFICICIATMVVFFPPRRQGSAFPDFLVSDVTLETRAKAARYTLFTLSFAIMNNGTDNATEVGGTVKVDINGQSWNIAWLMPKTRQELTVGEKVSNCYALLSARHRNEIGHSAITVSCAEGVTREFQVTIP